VDVELQSSINVLVVVLFMHGGILAIGHIRMRTLSTFGLSTFDFCRPWTLALVGTGDPLAGGVDDAGGIAQFEFMFDVLAVSFDSFNAEMQLLSNGLGG
jgi:hypothetical protein